MARALRPRDLFGRPGYVRVPNPARQESDGRKYRKGWEVRLVAADEDQANRIADLARALGYRPGRIFRKHRQLVVPVYGKEAADAFLRIRERRGQPP
jgi:hypothetical protein